MGPGGALKALSSYGPCCALMVSEYPTSAPLTKVTPAAKPHANPSHLRTPHHLPTPTTRARPPSPHLTSDLRVLEVTLRNGGPPAKEPGRLTALPWHSAPHQATAGHPTFFPTPTSDHRDLEPSPEIALSPWEGGDRPHQTHVYEVRDGLGG